MAYCEAGDEAERAGLLMTKDRAIDLFDLCEDIDPKHPEHALHKDLSKLIDVMKWVHFNDDKVKPSAARFRERLSHLKMVRFATRQAQEVYDHLGVAKQVASEVNMVINGISNADSYSYMVAKRDLMGFMEPTKSDISERACEYEDGAFDASAGK